MRNLQTILFLIQILISFKINADEFHYQDLIIGERAAGLAGAYTSISDDPSGLYHNPAGIIYNFENYFSLSANVYKTSKLTYKKAVSGQDYTMKSSGWVPNFFGATQNYGKMKFGFAILSPSTEVLDLDDKISDISSVANETQSVRRRLMRQYSVSLYGMGLAVEPIKDLAAGASLFLGQLTDKSINTQTQIFNGSPDKYAINENFNDQNSLFLFPKLGLQWMPAPKWSIGATAATTFTVYTNQKVRTSGAKLVNGQLPNGSNNDVTNHDTFEENYKPNVLSPYEFGLGTSYFPTKSLLFAFDLKYFSDDPSFKSFKTVPVVNVAFGAEWFASDRIVLRGGVYTNNANTPKLDASKMNQTPNVDYLGATAGITLESPGSSFTLCTQFSQGKGKGQILSNTTVQQDIDASTVAVYITASYQL